MAETPTFEDHEFIEVLQLHAAGLLAEDEARDAMRRLRPDYYGNDEGVNLAAPQPRKYVARRVGRYWTVSLGMGGYIAEFTTYDKERGRRLAELFADVLNEHGEPAA